MSAFSREFFSFVEVAREGSIRRAAEKLNVSASALSRQMQLLEQDFGTRLFARIPQGVQLTEQGRTLLRQAEKWLDDEGGLRAAMRAAPADIGTPLRLGVMECLVPFLRAGLPPDDGPPLKVTVGGTASLVDGLRANQLDAAIAFNVPRLPELRVHAERDDDLGLVYAPGMAPAGVPPFRLEQCLDHPLCLPDMGLSVWPRLNAENLPRPRRSADRASKQLDRADPGFRRRRPRRKLPQLARRRSGRRAWRAALRTSCQPKALRPALSRHGHQRAAETRNAEAACKPLSSNAAGERPEAGLRCPQSVHDITRWSSRHPG